MLVWVNRCKIDKSEGHVTYIDLYQDDETQVQYYGLKDSLVLRVDNTGNPFKGPPLKD